MSIPLHRNSREKCQMKHMQCLTTRACCPWTQESTVLARAVHTLSITSSSVYSSKLSSSPESSKSSSLKTIHQCDSLQMVVRYVCYPSCIIQGCAGTPLLANTHFANFQRYTETCLQIQSEQIAVFHNQ